MTSSPAVSVIIPCYNQGRFLADAIESALNQSYNRREVIVVDDGSTDDSSQVVSKYSDIILVRQQNRGLSAARNAGIEASAGDYLVFLDADDRLLPHALEAGVDAISRQSECPFVYGYYDVITADGVPIPTSQRKVVQDSDYLNMLQSNYIGMHATVMYQRRIFAIAGGFDTSLAACEDYDLFLRITRHHRIHCHGKTIAEYRQHDSNMSYRNDLMLKHSLRVLASEWKYARGSKEGREAYKAGAAHWRRYYGARLIKSVRQSAQERDWSRAIRGVLVLLRHYPRGLANKAFSRLIGVTTRAPRFFSVRASR
jgi:glycosyltransferase involved in cell wall biosynthesis